MGTCSSRSEHSLFTAITRTTCPKDILEHAIYHLNFHGPFISPLPCVKRTVQRTWRRNFYPLLGSYTPIPQGEEMVSFSEMECLAFDLGEGHSVIKGARVHKAHVYLDNLHTCKVIALTHEGEEKTIEMSLSLLIDTVIACF